MIRRIDRVECDECSRTGPLAEGEGGLDQASDAQPYRPTPWLE